MNPRFTGHYSLDGQLLAISVPRPEMLRELDAMLASLRAAATGNIVYSIAVTETQSLPDLGGSTVFEGDVPVDGRCRMLRDADRIHVVFPDLQALSIAANHAEIQVAAGTQVNWTVWMLALDAALDAGGQHMLHMAGLTLPGTGEVVLVHAPSGTGKTTMALALASRGFGLCSDDAMIVRFAPGKVTAWGLPRHVKIHRNTAAMLPFVAPCLGAGWDANGEQAVDLDRLGAVVQVEPPRGRGTAALFHLARSGDGETRLAPMAATDAMVALAADNVRTSMAGLLPAQRRRMTAIAQLVSSVPVYRLETGRAPADAAALIRSMGGNVPAGNASSARG